MLSPLNVAKRAFTDLRSGRHPRSLRPTIDTLEARSLLSVTFTGDVALDFPADRKGVAIVADSDSVSHPAIPPFLQGVVKVSGFDISGIRLIYTPDDDTLSIGLEQPLNPASGHPVIAGDADGNGDASTLNPLVTLLSPGFLEYSGIGGSEKLYAFLDLTGDGHADVVAGIASYSGKYEVAVASINPSFPTIPTFGAALSDNTGTFFLKNDADHPGFEFSIARFSKLYLSVTGKALTPGASVGVGAYGGSLDDGGISEAIFPARTVALNFDVPQPTPPSNPAPPANPTTPTPPAIGGTIDVKEPGSTASQAFTVARETAGQVHSGAIESPDDVDLFAIRLRRGERLIVRVTDTWNQTGRRGGLRASVRIFNPRGPLNIGRVHTSADNSFQVKSNRRDSAGGTYLVGISAAGNDRYRLNGRNVVAAGGSSNQGSYQVSFEIVPARRGPRIVFLTSTRNPR